MADDNGDLELLQRIAQRGKTPEHRAWAKQELAAHGIEALEAVQEGPYRDNYVHSPHVATLGPTRRMAPSTTAKAPPPSQGETAVRSFIEGMVPGAHGWAGSSELDTEVPRHTAANPFLPIVTRPEGEREAGISAEKARLRAGQDAYPKTALGSGLAAGAVGMMAGPGRVAFEGAKHLPFLGGAAKGLASTLLKGAGKGVAAYEATAPAAAAISDIDEVGPGQAAVDAATNPIGIALAGTLGAGGAALGRFASKTRDPSNQMGRTLADVDAEGGTVNAFGDEPVSGGTFDKPAVKNQPEGRLGVNRAGGSAAKKFTKYNRMKLAQERARYDGEFDKILSEVGDERIEPKALAQRVSELIDENAVENVVTDHDLDAVLNKFATIFEASGDGTLRARDVIKLKQMVNAKAEHGAPGTAANRPYRLLGQALADDAASIDPRLKPLNEQYAKVMGELENANDVMYGQDKVDIKDRAAAERTAAANIGRMGDSTQAGTLRVDQLEALAKSNPVYKQIFGEVKAVKAREALRYGDSDANQQPIEQSLQRGGGGILGLLGLTPRNRQIAATRMGLPVADKAGPVAEKAPAFMTGLDMSIEDGRQRRKKRAAAAKQKQ